MCSGALPGPSQGRAAEALRRLRQWAEACAPKEEARARGKTGVGHRAVDGRSCGWTWEGSAKGEAGEDARVEAGDVRALELEHKTWARLKD